MDPLGLLLVVLAALAFSGLDVVRKLLTDRVRLVPLLFAMTAGVVPIYTVWFLLVGGAGPQEGYVVPAAASVVLNVAANLLFLGAVREGGLAATVPLLSLTPVFTALAAMPLLGERPTVLQWGGILAVVAGAFLLHDPQTADERRRHARGAWMMVGVAVCWSVAPPLDKLSMEASSPMFHGIVLQGGVALAVLPYLLTAQRGWWAETRASAGLITASVALSAVAVALQLVAMERVLVGLLETTKRGVGSTAAVLLGVAFFSERAGFRRWAAVAIMTAGVATILL